MLNYDFGFFYSSSRKLGTCVIEALLTLGFTSWLSTCALTTTEYTSQNLSPTYVCTSVNQCLLTHLRCILHASEVDQVCWHFVIFCLALVSFVLIRTRHKAMIRLSEKNVL